VDSITQAALGAAVGEAVLGKKMGNHALLWGIFFGTLPDLDVMASPFLDTSGKLIFHRGATHSLLVMVLASFFLAKPLSRLWKRAKVTPTRAGSFVFLTWLTHVLIDCFTVYGTSVLWPFSETRVAFNNLFIIDPLYTAPLLGSLLCLAFYRGKKQQAKRMHHLKWGLWLSSGYVALSFGFKAIASAAFEADLKRRNIVWSRRMEAPTPFNTLLWRSVVERGDEILVGYRSVLELPSSPIRWTIYPRQKSVLARFEKEPEIETLDWFSQAWWIARPHAQGVWIADMRFGETRRYDSKPGMVDSRIMFSWSFDPEATGDRLSGNRPEISNPGDSIKRIFQRILTKKNWEANPRLAGVPGTLPESLPILE
jgi:inner membrane protein